MNASVVVFGILAALVANGQARHPCFCTRELEPVCGSDLRTYSNPCTLNCAKFMGESPQGKDLSILHIGGCEEEKASLKSTEVAACPCARIYAPVCGTDDVTYPNLCELNCAAKRATKVLAVAHEGKCASGEVSPFSFSAPVAAEKGACVCPLLYQPVCGTDGETYSNGCDLECARVKGTSKKGIALAQAHDGPCVSLSMAPLERFLPCICPRLFFPVCGTDDKTYTNPCELNCARTKGSSSKGSSLAIAHEGACEVKKISFLQFANVVQEPGCICPFIYSPVCANNGRTFSNTCLFECERKTSFQKDLKIAHSGVC